MHLRIFVYGHSNGDKMAAPINGRKYEKLSRPMRTVQIANADTVGTRTSSRMVCVRLLQKSTNHSRTIENYREVNASLRILTD